MYNRLKKLYLAGRLNDTGLENAVTRGWITEDQKAEIIEAKLPHPGRTGAVRELPVFIQHERR